MHNDNLSEHQQILQWLRAYPLPSDKAGVVWRLARIIKDELIAAWSKEDGFDLQQAIMDLQRLQQLLQNFHQPLQQLKWH
jgi:hypothetical protein